MKKFFKGIMAACLALVMLCPLALVGCDKNYTINIQIVENGIGCGVYMKDIDGISVVGNNTIGSGKKFEYFVAASDKYKIAKVVVDGVEQTNYNENGSYFYLDKINKNHSIKVYFEARKFEITFMCLGAGGLFEEFKTVEISYGSGIDLNQAAYGGATALWYYKDGNKNIYFYNESEDVNAAIPEGYESNMLFVHGSNTVYCNKTASELEAMGVTR